MPTDNRYNSVQDVCDSMLRLAPTCENDWMAQLEEWAEALKRVALPPPKIAVLWSSGAQPNWFFTADLTKRVFPAMLGAPPTPVYETRDPIIPLHAFHETVEAARRVWMDENPCEDGRDHVTPFDRFLYDQGRARG